MGELEGGRKEVGEGGFDEGSVGCGVKDAGIRCGELGDGLAAGAAGLGGGVVEVGDGDGLDAEVGAVQGDGGGDGVLLGAGGEAEGGVFDIAAGDDVAVTGEECRADEEVAVGGVGVLGCGKGALVEVRGLSCGVVRGVGHGECEAIGCVL